MDGAWQMCMRSRAGRPMIQYAHTHTYTHTHIHTYTHTHIHAYTHTHTYTHTVPQIKLEGEWYERAVVVVLAVFSEIGAWAALLITGV